MGGIRLSVHKPISLLGGFQDGDWLPGRLISEENMFIHEGAPSRIMLSSV